MRRDQHERGCDGAEDRLRVGGGGRLRGQGTGHPLVDVRRGERSSHRVTAAIHHERHEHGQDTRSRTARHASRSSAPGAGIDGSSRHVGWVVVAPARSDGVCRVARPRDPWACGTSRASFHPPAEPVARAWLSGLRVRPLASSDRVPRPDRDTRSGEER